MFTTADNWRYRTDLLNKHIWCFLYSNNDSIYLHDANGGQHYSSIFIRSTFAATAFASRIE